MQLWKLLNVWEIVCFRTQMWASACCPPTSCYTHPSTGMFLPTAGGSLCFYIPVSYIGYFPCGGTMACTLGSCLGHSMSLLMTWPMSLMVGLGGRWDTFQIFFSLQTFQIGFFVEHIQELAASEISSTDPNSVKCLHSFLLQHIFFAIVFTNFFILLSHISFLCVLKNWNCFDECFTFLFESLWSANFTNQKWRKNLKKMHWLQRITRYLKVIQVMALLKAYTKTQIYN